MERCARGRAMVSSLLRQWAMRPGLAVALVVAAVASSPGAAWAVPGIPSCPSNQFLAPFTNVCVVPAGTTVPNGPNCGGGAGDVCPAGTPGVDCFESLDDAVNVGCTAAYPPPGGWPANHPPTPSCVIGVFGPTVETFPAPAPALKVTPFQNVVIDRGPPADPTKIYPLVIEECHNAKIGGIPGGIDPTLPVIDIVPTAGPVSMNNVEVQGTNPWVPGIQVQNAATTLKAVRSHDNGIGALVKGSNATINGCTFEHNGDGLILARGSTLNDVVNTNRARSNSRNGFIDNGVANFWHGNIAESNLSAGFLAGFAASQAQFVDNRSRKNNGDGFHLARRASAILLDKNQATNNSGNGFTIEGDGNIVGTRRGGNLAKNNAGDGFSVSRFGDDNTFDRNRAQCNAGDGLDVRGDRNSFGNTRSCGNAINQVANFEYSITGSGTSDSGNNRACNTPVSLGGPPPVLVSRTVRACFNGGGTGGGGGGGNNAPRCNFTANPRTGAAPLTVQFVDTSTDSDGGPLSAAWNFSDPPTSTLANPTHTFNVPGEYTVTLTVTDNQGASCTKVSPGLIKVQ
jgi:hypothetical protein